MASVFGHSLLAGALGASLPDVLRKPKVICLGIICSIFPDADVLSFRFGIPYEGFWGHRGMTHSLFFGIVFGLVVMLIFHLKAHKRNQLKLFLYYSICTISHGILDGMTTGGRGVAYLSPFANERYFLPFRKIMVSPLGAQHFFSEWGLAVLKSEALWIGIPSILFICYSVLMRRNRN